jgi:DNA-dependent RNA polymerase auxiliary subunit epsilon
MESNKFCMNGYAGNYLKAGSENLTNEDSWILAVDEDHQVRRRVAENRLCPMEVLVALSSDQHEDVRIAVGEHPEVPPVVLEHLAEDESDDVRYALAENANVRVEILQKLSEDQNPYVGHRARQTLRILNPATVRELNPRQQSEARYFMSM